MSNALKYVFIPLLALLLALQLRESVGIVKAIFFPTPPMTVSGNLDMYLWTAVGAVAYTLLRGLLRKNIVWLETFSHELTHIVVSLMLFSKIQSFRAGQSSGEVTTSGSDVSRVFVSLAPYCLPIFTYLLLFFRPLIKADSLYVYDILVGISIAFHAICFKTQTGNHQPDINRFPLFFSYLYIAAALLFNLNTILVSYWSSKNVFTAFVYSLQSMWEGTTSFISLIT